MGTDRMSALLWILLFDTLIVFLATPNRQKNMTNTKNDPQKKHCLGTVSEKIFTGLKLFSQCSPHPQFRCGPRHIDVGFA